ncbi:MAG TPA: Crp/Fnr family transcriptional regulator [Puia sp.]|nr:Crp/Fnr family transcriptional regulator [Puia sp.]
MLFAWEKYKHLWCREELPAHTLLLREGDVCKRVYVIRTGAVRAWFDHGDKEICFQFFFEGDVVYAPESLRRGTPSPFNLETIEPGTFYRISADDLEKIREDTHLYSLILDKVVQRHSEFMQHFFTFLKDTPQQRYEDLLRHKPEVVRRVPLQYIASYLGITQVSLSRIRARSRGI